MNEPKGPFVLKVSFTYLSTLLGLLFLLCIGSSAFAQDDLNIHGSIADAMSSSKIGGVKVTVKKDGAVHESFTTRANGKYEFYLDCGSHYELLFEKEGYVNRSIIIDSKNVPEEVVGAGIIMPTDMSMYAITEAMKDMDMSVFEKPIGMASYNAADQDLSWDFGHTTKVKAEIFAFIREVEKKQKELEKEANQEDKEAEELEAKFAQFVKDGDNAMAKQKYQDAVLNYKAALEIKADDPDVKVKLQDAEAKYDEQEAAKKLEEEYTAALDAGDGFMRTEEYEKAIEQYKAALTLKAGEAYPTEQIALATKTLDELKANMANQEKFDQLIGEGDALVAEKKYEEALAPYKEALGLIPANREVQRKIDEAELAIQNKEKLAKQQADYDAMLATADAAFQAENFEEAKTAYENANSILPDESYPVEQMAICVQKISDLANAEELQAKFDAAMQQGETALTATDFAKAIESFTEALTIKTDDATAQAKLSEAQNLLDEQQAAAGKQENYDALVEEANALFADENYTEAVAKYQAAKEVFPEEIYPTEQITKINALIADMEAAAAIQKKYDDAMAAGTTAALEENYTEAIGQFEAALVAIPEDKDATSALEEATSKKAELDANSALAEQYQALIDAADQKFANEQLDEAKVDYLAAIELKKEQYPSDQIGLIETMIAEKATEAEEAARMAELQAAYDAHMQTGDEAMTSERYSDAVKSFEAALTVIADDALATSKLEEANTLMQSKMDAAALDDLYKSKLTDADALFQAKDYEAAKEAYTACLEIKADEAYPKDQMAVIDELIAADLAAKAAADADAKAQMVADLLIVGDQFLNEEAFQSAIDKYEEALVLAPDRSDIQPKIANANAMLLAYLENQANQDAYNAAIAEGDKLYDSENWARSKSEYEKALEINGSQEHPKTRIADIDLKLAQLAEQEELERMQLLGAEFNAFIEAGDKRFNKQKYDKALVEYEAALNLIPDSEIANEKIASVNAILAQQAEGEALQQAYADLIDQGDTYFNADNLEMSKLKYLDAQELMPEERYPADKIIEIDRLLEKQRLNAEADELAAIEEKYREAIAEADGFMNERNYIMAVDGYESALEIKSEERYPQSQLERIELLIKEEEADALERERLAELARENASKTKRAGGQSSVNTNSEDQAEQFMRDAREAQERERYERIKAEKERHAENMSNYESHSRTQRMSYELGHEYFSISNDERFASAAQSNENQRSSSGKYKEALQRNQTKQSEIGQVRGKYAYEQMQKESEARSSHMSKMTKAQNQKINEARDEFEAQKAEFEKRSAKSANQKKEFNEQIQAEAAELYTRNKAADELRYERSKEIVEANADREDYYRKLADQNLNDIRAKAAQNAVQSKAYEEKSRQLSDEKVNENARALAKQKEAQNSAMSDSQLMADAKRARNAEELASLQQGEAKSYDDYFRTDLADSYPQGVSEESSTLGNKVIITRIVVKGNRGDEYKKVVDKAGNYYFKNGSSISQHTWNRETIQAFNKSKD